MLKKLLALVSALAFMTVLPALAATAETHKAAPHKSGTITAWDHTTRQFTIKYSAGKETSFAWNDKTKVAGTPKVGEHASVSYTKDKDGKRSATHFTIGEKPAPTMPPAPN